MKCIDCRDALGVHFEICNGLNLFGNQNRKILIAKLLAFIGKVTETFLFYLKKKVFRISILTITTCFKRL
ncbi:MAG: hypothetical protein A2007_01890 [Verrucomicrobia bacterium GWC2_42_7]|nr:MAG: hypothetical protein A2007_01890 [Verrucomicrobia bacterium GWC2_42_7]